MDKETIIVELLAAVDENGELTGQHIDRVTAHKEGIPHAGVQLFVLVKHQGEQYLLMQRRSVDVDMFPGALTAAVGGHVQLGESYEQALAREKSEELGKWH